MSKNTERVIKSYINYIEAWQEDINQYNAGDAINLSDLRKEIECEKQMKIVDAVNYFKGELEKSPHFGRGIIYRGLEAGFFQSLTCKTENELVCTEDEFYQCIKELSEAAWLNKEAPGEPQYYDAWKRAQDDMQAAEAVEWNGEGLPPVGCECEIKNKKATKDLARPGFYKAKIKAYGDELMIIESAPFCADRLESVADIKDYLFRPIETQQQKADREREEKAKMFHGVFQKVRLNQKQTQSFCEFNWQHLTVGDKQFWLDMIDAGVKLPE